MASDEERGRKLLNTWKNMPALIQMSFVVEGTVAPLVTIDAKVGVLALDEKQLLLGTAGGDVEVILSLEEGRFVDVSDEGILYPPYLELDLPIGRLRLTFSAGPPA